MRPGDDPMADATTHTTADELLTNGQYEQAIQAYTHVLDADPTAAAARYGRGVARYLLRRDSEADTDLRTCLALEPDHANALYYRAAIAARLGDRARATLLA